MATQESDATKAAASNGEVKMNELVICFKSLGGCRSLLCALAPGLLLLYILKLVVEPDDVVRAGWFQTTPLLPSPMRWEMLDWYRVATWASSVFETGSKRLGTL